MLIFDVNPVFTKMLTMSPSVRERMLNYCYHINEDDPAVLNDADLAKTYLEGFAAITTQPAGEITTDQVAEALGHLAGWV